MSAASGRAWPRRTRAEIALVQYGPVAASLALLASLIAQFALGLPAAVALRIAAATVFAAAGWMSVRTRGAARIPAALLFAVPLAVAVAAPLVRLAEGGADRPVGVVGALALVALVVPWLASDGAVALLPRDPAFEVLRRVEAARAFAASMEVEEYGHHADEILALLAEAEPYRRPDTAEYLDLTVARWREYLGAGPALPDPGAAAERWAQIHLALGRRFRPYNAWAGARPPGSSGASR